MVLSPLAGAVSELIVFSHWHAPTRRVPLESSRKASLEEALATRVPLEFLAGSLKRTSVYMSTGPSLSAKQCAQSLAATARAMDSRWPPHRRHEVGRVDLEVGRADLEVGDCYSEESVALAASLET